MLFIGMVHCTSKKEPGMAQTIERAFGAVRPAKYIWYGTLCFACVFGRGGDSRKAIHKLKEVFFFGLSKLEKFDGDSYYN